MYFQETWRNKRWIERGMNTARNLENNNWNRKRSEKMEEMETDLERIDFYA